MLGVMLGALVAGNLLAELAYARGKGCEAGASLGALAGALIGGLVAIGFPKVCAACHPMRICHDEARS